MKFRKFFFLYNITFILIIIQIYGNIHLHIIKQHSAELQDFNLSDKDEAIIENRDSKNKLSSLHLWFGINTPHEIRSGLIKTFTDILSKIPEEDWPPKITREIQGHETKTFRQIINQKPAELETKLYLVKGTEHIAARQVSIRRVNVNCNASYVLQSPEAIFVIHGSKANEEEKKIAEMLAKYILEVDASEYTVESKEIKIGILTKTELLTRNQTITQEKIKKLKEELATLRSQIATTHTVEIFDIGDTIRMLENYLKYDVENDEKILEMNFEKYRTNVSENELPGKLVEENKKVLDKFYSHISRSELLNKRNIFSYYSSISDEEFVHERYETVNIELQLAENYFPYPMDEKMCDIFNIHEIRESYYFHFSCNTGLIFEESVKRWEKQKLTFHVYDSFLTEEPRSFIHIGRSSLVTNEVNRSILQSGEDQAYGGTKLMFVQSPYPAAFLIHFRDYKEIISKFLGLEKNNSSEISFATDGYSNLEKCS